MEGHWSEAPDVLGDGLDLVVGEQVAEGRHAAAPLALEPVPLPVLGARLDEVDHVRLVGEVSGRGGVGQVPPERAVPWYTRVAPRPAGRVAPGARVGPGVEGEVEQRLAVTPVGAVGDRL